MLLIRALFLCFSKQHCGMAHTARKVLVELFYDVVSPYSYVAFEALTQYNHEWPNMDLQLKPVFLGGIMAGSNNRPPATNPNRAKYMSKDLPMLAKCFDLPFKFPDDLMNVMFGKGTLSTQRFLTATSQSYPQHLEPLSRELFSKVWIKDEDVTTPESLKEAGEKVGIAKSDLDHLVGLVKDDKVKQQLKDTTQMALDHGAFGAPTYVAHMENGPVMLFGCDRLFLLAHLLGNQWQAGPLNRSKV